MNKTAKTISISGAACVITVVVITYVAALLH